MTLIPTKDSSVSEGSDDSPWTAGIPQHVGQTMLPALRMAGFPPWRRRADWVSWELSEVTGRDPYPVESCLIKEQKRHQLSLPRNQLRMAAGLGQGQVNVMKAPDSEYFRICDCVTLRL